MTVAWRPAQRSPIADRDTGELYETPRCAVKALIETGELDRFTRGAIWEPCAGRGAISRELRTKGFRVVAQDLIDYDGADAGIETPRETYLRQARGYGGELPSTLGFLPGQGQNAPALVAAFGLPAESEPGALALDDAAVKAVQLVKLRADGAGKADVDDSKIIIGQGAMGSPIVLAPPNDLLGLAITEGLEDALSIHEATGLGAWAAGGAVRLPALAAAVPGYIDCVTVIADDDDAGRRYAPELVARLRERGIEATVKVWPS